MTGYTTLWTHVSFHLPQDTNTAKAAARKFIKALRLKCGGTEVVMSRGSGAGLLCCPFSKANEVLAALLPPDGELRLVPVTDKQVEHSRIYWGKPRKVLPSGAV